MPVPEPLDHVTRDITSHVRDLVRRDVVVATPKVLKSLELKYGIAIDDEVRILVERVAEEERERLTRKSNRKVGLLVIPLSAALVIALGAHLVYVVTQGGRFSVYEVLGIGFGGFGLWIGIRMVVTGRDY